MRKIYIFILSFFLFPAAASGQTFLPLNSPSVILMEQSTGKILYAKNERVKMYPASMTKILTCLVALDYLEPDDILTVGGEIRGMPAAYNTNIHFEGETITVRNLLRALMIRSGNETGHVVAINAIRKKEGRHNIAWPDAERAFSALMNEKARSLGAVDSHFNNPYGFHSESHYTTAYDLALITRAYMEIPLLKQIGGEVYYSGNSLEGRTLRDAKVNEYSWASNNMLMREDSPYYLPYATGLKTGFTDAAGQCLASTAEKNISLIAIVFHSADPGRWNDSRLLFEYAFETYDFRTVQTRDVHLDTVYISNPRLGERDDLIILSNDEVKALLNQAELSRIQKTIIYNEEYLYTGEENETGETHNDGAIRLKGPIEKDADLGSIILTLDGETLFTGSVRAARDVAVRNFDSDMDYYIKQFSDNIFTFKAFPYWFGFTGFLVGITGISFSISVIRRARKDRWRSSWSGSKGSGGRGYYNRYR